MVEVRRQGKEKNNSPINCRRQPEVEFRRCQHSQVCVEGHSDSPVWGLLKQRRARGTRLNVIRTDKPCLWKTFWVKALNDNVSMKLSTVRICNWLLLSCLTCSLALFFHSLNTWYVHVDQGCGASMIETWCWGNLCTPWWRVERKETRWRGGGGGSKPSRTKRFEILFTFAGCTCTTESFRNDTLICASKQTSHAKVKLRSADFSFFVEPHCENYLSVILTILQSCSSVVNAA